MSSPEPQPPAAFKRYCKTLRLHDDAQLIEAYKQGHAPAAVWPEIG